MAEAPLKKKGRPRQWPFASILTKMGGSSSKNQQQTPSQTPIPQPSLSPLARTQSAPTLQHLQQQMARQSNSPQMYPYAQQQQSSPPFSPQQVAWEELPPLTSNTTTLPAGIADPPVHTMQQQPQQQFSQQFGVTNGGNLSNNNSFTFNGSSNHNNSSNNVSSVPSSPQKSSSPRTTSPRSTPFSPYPTPLQRKTSRGNTLNNNSSQNLKNMAPAEPSNTLLKKAATFCMGQNNKMQQHPQKYEDVFRQQQQQFNGGSLSRTSSFGNGVVPPYRSSNNSSAASSLNGSPVNSLPSSPNSSFSMHYPNNNNNRVENTQGLPSFNEFLSTIPSVKEMTQEESELQAKLTMKEQELKNLQQELEKLKIQQKMNGSTNNNAQMPILPPVTSFTHQDAYVPQYPVSIKPDPFISRNNMPNPTLPALNMRSKFDEDDEEIGNLFSRNKTIITTK